MSRADWNRASGLFSRQCSTMRSSARRNRPIRSRRGPADPSSGSPPSCRPPCRRGTRAGPRASRRGSPRRKRCRCARRPACRAPARATCSRACRGRRPARCRGVTVGRFVCDRPAPSGCVSLARPKSRILTRPSVGHEDVLGLEVPVHDPLLVRRREALRDLQRVADRPARREGPAGEPLAQRLAFEQLRDDVGRAVVRADVVDRQDVRVVQRRRRLRLLLESARGARGRRRTPPGRTLIATSRSSRVSRAR